MCNLFFRKTNPPTKSYFLSHYNDDPFARFVFVATDNDRLIASVRVFTRHIFTPALQPVFGIGEVCTLKEARHQGIARHLLTYAMEHVSADAFFLHCAPWIQPFYERIGFVSAPAQTCDVQLDNVTTESVCFKTVQTDANDATRLAALSNQFHADWVMGPVYRTATYVQHWLKADVTMAVLDPVTLAIIAFASCTQQPHSPCVYLSDFGCVPDADKYVRPLLRKCLDRLDANTSLMSLTVPLPFASRFQLEYTNVQTDPGWLFKNVATHDRPCLIWAVDKF